MRTVGRQMIVHLVKSLPRETLIPCNGCGSSKREQPFQDALQRTLSRAFGLPMLDRDRLDQDRSVSRFGDADNAIATDLPCAHHEAGARRIRPDVVAKIDGRTIAIELRYFCSEMDCDDISAQVYESMKDCARLDRLMETGSVDHGFCVVLTDQPVFWDPAARQGRKNWAREFYFRDLAPGDPVPLNRRIRSHDRSTGHRSSGHRRSDIALASPWAYSWHDYGCYRNRDFRFAVFARETGTDEGTPWPVAGLAELFARPFMAYRAA